MPEQQEWLAKQLQDCGGILIGPKGTRRVVDFLLSAYPSSPQGLAVKQMVEALKRLRRHHNGAQPIEHGIAVALIDEVVTAARKAGLGT